MKRILRVLAPGLLAAAILNALIDDATVGRAIGDLRNLVFAGGGVALVSLVVSGRRARRLTVRHPARRSAAVGEIIASTFEPLVRARVALGVSVATVVAGETTVHHVGRTAEGGAFEIGSLTKPMTGELLAQLVIDGRVHLDDQIGAILDVRLPPPVAAITLRELATQRSGLPRLPPGHRMLAYAWWSTDPYRRITRDRLVASLRRTKLRGKTPLYSNFGFGVLGLVLGQVAGGGYEEALRQYLLVPCEMTETYVGAGVPAEVTGHDVFGVPVPAWHLGALAGCGGVKTTIDDAAKWIAAHLDPHHPCRPAMELATRPTAQFQSVHIGLGWGVQTTPTELFWHNGGTGGFSSFAVVAPQSGVGIVALAPSAHRTELDRAGMEALRRLTLSRRAER